MGIKTKRGNIGGELITIVVILLLMGIIFGVGKIVTDLINPLIQDEPGMSQVGKDIASDWSDDYASDFDGVILTVAVILWIAALLSAFLIETHPAFYVLSLIILVFFCITVPHIANAYGDFISSSGIALEDEFPYTVFLMKHLLEYVIVVGFTSMMVLYGKTR